MFCRTENKKEGTNLTNSSAVPNLAQQPRNSHLLEDQQQPSEQQHCRIPFDHLKRAVASNLPCFLIEYDQVDNSKKRPSDVTAASLIEDHFRQQGISITFSLVGHTGNKLKLGVNNKETYAILVSTDKWPTQINNININIIKPKFTPDSFALVVRYVPLQYSDEFVKDEIECNLQSAENVRRIQYRFKRRTNDFRFIVKDIREYNSTLKLGRISIGNSFCTITPFLTGNRMTYCTRCWCIGHMRNKCDLEHPRCRICLNNLFEGQLHNCSNIVRCAQCDGGHHSLSSECAKVIEYRSELKEQVNNAIAAGKLHRVVPQDRAQPMQFQMKKNDFPPLPSQSSRANPWKPVSAQPSVTTDGNDDTTKMLFLINQNILDMKENTQRINEKLDRINDKVDQTALDAQLHHETLMKVIPTLISLTEEFIWPMMVNDVAGLRNKQQRLQHLFSSLESSLTYLKTDYTARRKRSSSPSSHPPPSQQPSKSSDNKSKKETDQNMSS